MTGGADRVFHMRWSILAILLSGSSALVAAGWQAIERGGTGVDGAEHPLAVIMPYLEGVPGEAAIASPAVAVALVAAAYYALRLLGLLLSFMSVATLALLVAFVVYPDETRLLRTQAQQALGAALAQVDRLSNGGEGSERGGQRLVVPDDDRSVLPRWSDAVRQPTSEPRAEPDWPILPEDRVERGRDDAGGLDPFEPAPTVAPQAFEIEDETGLAEARAIMGQADGR